MNGLPKIIEEDLGAALGAFRSDAFDTVNIYANRIMSNALFGTETKLFLLGFFLKDVAFTFMALKTRKKASAFSTAKSRGFSFVEFLKNSLSPLNEENLWKEYHDFSDAIRKFEMDEFEEASYSDNREFTKNAFSWLFNYLKTNTKILCDSDNVLLKGILNEMNRIFRAHSGELSETVLMSLIKALDRYYDYFRRIHEKPDGSISEDRIKKGILPYIDQIEKACIPEPKISEVDSILWDLVKGWREFYIQRMEIIVTRPRYRKGVEIPEELKKKISESMTKNLEKEI